MATVKGNHYNFVIIPAPVGTARDCMAIFSETFAPGATADVRQLIKVPINVTILPSSFMQVGDMDTGTALVLTLRITDGITTKTIISASTVGQIGGIIRPTLGPTVEDAIGWTVNNNNYRLELVFATGPTGATSAAFIYGLGMTGWAADNAIKS